MAGMEQAQAGLDMNSTIENPYVGPRTCEFKDKELFFGRDREARDLSALVASDKLVLFYAQSGAGKSSLINTRLIPGLEDKDYQVLRVARVSGELSEDFSIDNIYIYNLMRSLIWNEIESSTLDTLSLSQFLAKLNEDESGEFFYDSSLTTDIPATEESIRRRALIIDQFEELFTTHPEAWDKREAFLKELAEAMQEDPYLWVVLAMREDHIAELDPYASLLPGGLRARYYMQRMGVNAALEAVTQPVARLREFEPQAAKALVENLSRISAGRDQR